MFDRMMAIDNVKKWVAEVGAIQLKRLAANDLGIRNKSTEFDLVTDVDQQSEQILIGRIKETYPGHSVLAEESGQSSRDSEYLWIIDPLDGTTNYAHGFPIFSISVALQYQGEVILGVVYIPAPGEMFHALKGDGAFLNGNRIKVSETTELKKALLATGFPYDKAIDPNNNLNYFCHMVPQIAGIRRSGSAAYDLCMVAAGRYDGYWELKLNLWDIAAGTLMVEEAGGQIIPLSGKKGISIIAANEGLGAFILAELQKVNPEFK
jgi:myo-inositol-1(or 4)-monophosphatase